MGLEKAIEHGKEKRKPWRGSKQWDCSCRNNGFCDYCKSNRTIQSQRAIAATEAALDQDFIPYYYEDEPEEILEQLQPDPTNPWYSKK